MRTWLTNLWIACATSFWFVPGLFLLGGIGLAAATPWVEDLLSEAAPAWIGTTETTARATLSALCGAMFTVTGVVFSTTCVALSITSTQLGPRLLRNFLSQQVTQVTIGVCLATSVYCLMLLRWVGEFDGTVFVPELSLVLASLLAVASLLLIVYFLHRVALAMQAQNVASSVADDLDAAMQRLYPESMGQPFEEAEEESQREATAWRRAWDGFDDTQTTPIYAARDGYLQAIDDDSLISIAQELEGVMRVHKRPGDYLREGDLLLDVRSDSGVDDKAVQRLQRCFIAGQLRTNQQDIECSVNELVEIGVRALSPGVNDPFTAITCVDRLSGALCRLATRKIPRGLRADSDGNPRLVIRPRSFPDILDTAFDQLRQHAEGDVATTLRLLESAEAIGDRVTRRADRVALARQIAMIADAANSAGMTPADLKKIEERCSRAEQSLSPDQPELLAESRVGQPSPRAWAAQET